MTSGPLLAFQLCPGGPPSMHRTVALSVSRRLEVEVIFSGAKVDGAGGHWCWR